MSQRAIERKYAALMKYVQTKEYYTSIKLDGRVNCYVCTCGHITKTKDIDPGVTPFTHQCEKCNAYARSTMYRDIAPDKEPTQEWYRPSLKEVLKHKKNPALLDHIFNGGLLSRKIEPQNTKAHE